MIGRPASRLVLLVLTAAAADNSRGGEAGLQSTKTPVELRYPILGLTRWTLVPLQDPGFEKIPDLQSGGLVTTWSTPPGPTRWENSILEFRVLSSGVVYLVVDYRIDTRLSGGNWQKERMTKEELIADGWTYLGEPPWLKGGCLFRRICSEGKLFTIRTNKYWPPSLVVPRNPNPRIVQWRQIPSSNPSAAPSSAKVESTYAPTGDTHTKAEASVETVYGRDIKSAVTSEAKSTLARRILKVADEEKSSALRYALLQRARDLAVSAGDAHLGYEITEALVKFTIPGTENRDGWAWIAEGDRLRDQAKAEIDRKAKLKARLLAAECYLKSEPNASGLTKEFIAKKISELAVDSAGEKNADLLILSGAWDVQVGKYRAVWTFKPDGTVDSTNGAPKGKWVAAQHVVTIQWETGAWETFQRPLSTVVSGNSWQRQTVQARKRSD